MTRFSVGDLSQAYQMRRHTAQLKADIAQHASEVTTGITANLSRKVAGDFSPVAGVERSLTTLKGYGTATSEAASFTASVQATLETVQSLSSGVASGLMLAATSGNPQLILAAGADALQRFTSAVSALNTRVADRTLLAGAATNGPAVAPAADILAALNVAIAGETSAAGAAQVISDWFTAPTGYGAQAYQGSATPLAPFQLGGNEEIAMGITANDPALCDLLAGFAMAALVGQGAFAGNATEQAALAKQAGERLLTAGGGMTNLRASVGTVEARIDEAQVHNTAEITTLTLTLNQIIGVDGYDAASALEERQTQLETLYTVTARLSRLSLVDMLR